MSGEQIMRKAGYAYFKDPKSGQDSFTRRLSSNFYPRFHVYIKEMDGKIFFNLHLDQKQASYPGVHKHNAEYDGPLAEEELVRLKQFILNLQGGQSLSGGQKEKKAWYRFW